MSRGVGRVECGRGWKGRMWKGLEGQNVEGRSVMGWRVGWSIVKEWNGGVWNRDL